MPVGLGPDRNLDDVLYLRHAEQLRHKIQVKASRVAVVWIAPNFTALDGTQIFH